MKKASRPGYFWQCVFFSIVYFIAARCSLLLAFPSSNASPVWPPSGIAVAGLLMLGLRLWPAISCAAFVANVVNFLAQGAVDANIYLVSFCIAIGNTLEAVALVVFLQRFVTGDWANVAPKALSLRLALIIKFILGALCASAISSAVGTSSLLIGSVIPASIWQTVNLTWWLGDVSGILLVTPLLVTWTIRPQWFQSSVKSLSGLLASLIAMAILAWVLFTGPFATPESVRPWIFLLAPALGVTVIGWGLRGASAANLVVAIVAIASVANGKGLFSLGELNDALVQLDLLLILFAVVGLVLAADMDERFQHNSRMLLLKKMGWSWIGLFIAVAASILIWHFGSLTTEKQIRDQFDARVNTIRTNLTARLEQYQLVLKGAAGLFNAHGQITHEAWREYVKSIDLRHSLQGVLGLGVALHVNEADFAAHVAGIRSDGFPGYTIHPPGKRPDYISIAYIEPFDAINQRAFGFDLATEPTRRAALELARDTGAPTITGKLTLLQSDDHHPQSGFLFMLPLYARGLPTSTPGQRRSALFGYVYSPIFMSEFMSAVLKTKFNDLLIEVDDGATASPANLMFTSTPGTQAKDNPRVLSRQVSIVVGQHSWLLTVHAAPAFLDTMGYQRSSILLLAGMLVGLSLFALVRTMAITQWRAEFKLQDNEEKLRGLFALSPLGIALTDMQGKYIEFNNAFMKMCGYAADELRALDYRVLTPKTYESQEKSQLELLRQTGRYGPYEKEYIQKSGTHVPIRLNGVMMQLQGQDYIWSIVEDISAQKQSERALRQAKQAAEQANVAKSAFLSNMSHEIRTPLNAILGLTQLVLESDLPAWQLDYLQKVYNSSQALLAILNDILDYSKIEAGKLDLEQRKFEIESVIDSCVALFSTQAGRKNLELLIDFAADVPKWVSGDALRLSQILNNLLGNAVKFTDRGEIHIQIRTLARYEKQVKVEFAVRDTGVGITREQASQLFQPFTQADNSVTRKHGGTGLGLAISRRLVELMNGEIVIESVPGAGSTFRFNIMLQLDPADEQTSGHEPELAGLNVVLVGEPTTARHILQTQLAAWKIQSLIANTGADALQHLEQAKTDNTPIDLLITDWEMQDMDGPELIRKINTLTTQGKIRQMPPVLVIAAQNRGQLLEQITGSGVSTVLTKPVMPSRLYDAILSACKPERRQLQEKSTPIASSYRTKAHAIRGARLLLVEDNATNQLVATEILKLAGFQIDVADDGLKAVEAAQNASYDAILMDVQMPGIDGFEATRRIRALPAHRNTPILAMTAGALKQDRDACLRAGMNEHVAKPIDAVELVDTLVKWIPAKSI